MPNSGYKSMINRSYKGQSSRPQTSFPHYSAPSRVISPSPGLQVPPNQTGIGCLSKTWDVLRSRRQYTQRLEDNKRKSTAVSFPPLGQKTGTPVLLPQQPPALPPGTWIIRIDRTGINTLEPFNTTKKHTCGYFYNRNTDNKKRKIGIPPSDLVKWRYFNPVSY